MDTTADLPLAPPLNVKGTKKKKKQKWLVLAKAKPSKKEYAICTTSGVSGCVKVKVGQLLAFELAVHFADRRWLSSLQHHDGFLQRTTLHCQDFLSHHHEPNARERDQILSRCFQLSSRHHRRRRRESRGDRGGSGSDGGKEDRVPIPSFSLTPPSANIAAANANDGGRKKEMGKVGSSSVRLKSVNDGGEALKENVKVNSQSSIPMVPIDNAEKEINTKSTGVGTSTLIQSETISSNEEESKDECVPSTEGVVVSATAPIKQPAVDTRMEVTSTVGSDCSQQLLNSVQNEEGNQSASITTSKYFSNPSGELVSLMATFRADIGESNIDLGPGKQKVDKSLSSLGGGYQIESRTKPSSGAGGEQCWALSTQKQAAKSDVSSTKQSVTSSQQTQPTSNTTVASKVANVKPSFHVDPSLTGSRSLGLTKAATKGAPKPKNKMQGYVTGSRVDCIGMAETIRTKEVKANGKGSDCPFEEEVQPNSTKNAKRPYKQKSCDKIESKVKSNEPKPTKLSASSKPTAADNDTSDEEDVTKLFKRPKKRKNAANATTAKSKAEIIEIMDDDDNESPPQKDSASSKIVLVGAQATKPRKKRKVASTLPSSSSDSSQDEFGLDTSVKHKQSKGATKSNGKTAPSRAVGSKRAKTDDYGKKVCSACSSCTCHSRDGSAATKLALNNIISLPRIERTLLNQLNRYERNKAWIESQRTDTARRLQKHRNIMTKKWEEKTLASTTDRPRFLADVDVSPEVEVFSSRAMINSSEIQRARGLIFGKAKSKCIH